MTNTVTQLINASVSVSELHDRIQYGIKIVPLLKRADDIFMLVQKELIANGHNNIVMFENSYCLEIIKDKKLSISHKYMGDNNYPFVRYCVEINYQNINSSTNIGISNLSFSPLHNNFSLYGNENYLVPKPFVHDEAWYFQKYTLHDLPPEDLYIAGTELIHEISKLDCNFVYMWINLRYDDDELENITKLLDLLESKYA
ncbi:hypothetical protein DQT32_04515 [Salmonella enterica subsp. enterica serovar Braenderup]|nr:hypothetical protein [Salmonella enterica subsp. enterica serovar Braenderup]